MKATKQIKKMKEKKKRKSSSISNIACNIWCTYSQFYTTQSPPFRKKNSNI